MEELPNDEEPVSIASHTQQPNHIFKSDAIAWLECKNEVKWNQNIYGIW